MDINTTSPKTVSELMSSYGIAPLKKFGQNFLVDANIADKIADAAIPNDIEKNDIFALEIGPGLGALTGRLLKKAGHVAAYEIDAGLIRALKDIFADAKDFSLFHQDFLKADLNKDLSEVSDGKEIFVAANLPYYITSPCIMKLLEAKLSVRRITVMIQKEVAERICAKPGSREYGAISAAVGYFADAKLLFSVSPSCFYPKPDVYSSVMTLHTKPHDSDKADRYLETVKALFAKRRKTVRSNLRESFSFGIEQAQAIIKNAGIDENARAEMLNVSDFIRLSEEIEKKQKKLLKDRGNIGLNVE